MNTYYTISLEKEIATHSSILAWRISWTEEPGGLQSMESQRVRHDRVTYTTIAQYNMISILEYPKFSSQFKANKCMLDILRASGPGKTSLEFLDL